MKMEQHEFRGHNVCRPVRTPLYNSHSKEENSWLCIISTPDANLETGAKTEHGRLGQNTQQESRPKGRRRAGRRKAI